MARRKRHSSSRSESAINITPLGDVSLSLLLGFLVITPIIIETMATTLPQEGSGVSAGAVRQDPIVVLTAEGQILLNGREVTEQELPGEKDDDRKDDGGDEVALVHELRRPASRPLEPPGHPGTAMVGKRGGNRIVTASRERVTP